MVYHSNSLAWSAMEKHESNNHFPLKSAKSGNRISLKELSRPKCAVSDYALSAINEGNIKLLVCVFRTFPWHGCCDSSEVHHRWAAILHVLHRRACLEFPAEWDKEERMKAGDTDIEAVTKRKKNQQATDVHSAESANRTKWPLHHMCRFFSVQVENEIKPCLSFIRLALQPELTLTAS